MAVFEMQGPDGGVYEVDAPDMEQAVSAFRTIQPSQLEAFARSAKQGVTMGFGDEIAGLQAAGRVGGRDIPSIGPTGLLQPMLGGARLLADTIRGEPGEATEAYEAARDKDRAGNKAAETSFPKTAMAGEIAGAVGGAVGPGLLIRGATLPVRALQAAGVGAGQGATAGAGAGETMEERASGAVKGGAIGAAVGVAGEGLVTGIGKMIQRYLGAAKAPAPGVNPTARIDEANELGVRLSRGQATGNIGQQSYEEAARHEARGMMAGQAMRRFDAGQADDFKAAKDKVSTTLGGGPAVADETGDAVAGGIRRQAEAFRSGADEAYKSAAAKEASIAAEEVANLGRKVADQLETNGIRLDTYGNYGGSQEAMNLLRRVAGFEGAAPAGGERVAAQSLQGLEQARQGLIKVKPTNGADARALGYIKRAFDDWISNAIDRKLFSGDPTALDDLIKARSLWSQYKGLTAGDKGDALPIIAKIATEERTGAEVANWLLNTVSVGQAGRSARVAVEVRRALGADSPEWEALRQAAWTKMLTPARGDGGNQAVSNSIMTFTAGTGAPLAKALFTPAEIGQMTKLARVMQYTVPDRRATNPSKTSYGMARLLGVNALGTGAGGAAYWWTGDPRMLAVAALPLLKGSANLSKGIAATRAQPSAFGEGVGTAARIGVAGGASYSGGR